MANVSCLMADDGGSVDAHAFKASRYPSIFPSSPSKSCNDYLTSIINCTDFSPFLAGRIMGANLKLFRNHHWGQILTTHVHFGSWWNNPKVHKIEDIFMHTLSLEALAFLIMTKFFSKNSVVWWLGNSGLSFSSASSFIFLMFLKFFPIWRGSHLDGLASWWI